MACHILGISAFYHDSAACLVRDGEIVAAAQVYAEEGRRELSRPRHRLLPEGRCGDPGRSDGYRVLRQAPPQV